MHLFRSFTLFFAAFLLSSLSAPLWAATNGSTGSFQVNIRAADAVTINGLVDFDALPDIVLGSTANPVAVVSTELPACVFANTQGGRNLYQLEVFADTTMDSSGHFALLRHNAGSTATDADKLPFEIIIRYVDSASTTQTPFPSKTIFSAANNPISRAKGTLNPPCNGASPANLTYQVRVLPNTSTVADNYTGTVTLELSEP